MFTIKFNATFQENLNLRFKLCNLGVQSVMADRDIVIINNQLQKMKQYDR